MSIKSIILGGGCFWCTEAVFTQVPGVTQVTSGYAGGHTNNPSYRQVCTGETGHAEVVKVEYDESQITLQEILLLFFKTHDPTTHHRQGADVGSQYRSVILFEEDEQETIAEEVVNRLEAEGVYAAPVVTEIEPMGLFWPAEAKHQNFYQKNPDYGYCQAVINPKLAKLAKILEEK